LNLKSETDTVIWNYALGHDFIVISKDRDFFDFACRHGDTGKLVWVRLGNCRNAPLLAAFENFLPQILTSLVDGSRIVELR
jgi:predicted nuclease of predicted toxin-antitoxin system